MKFRRLALIALPAALTLATLGPALPAHATTIPTAVNITRQCTKTSMVNLQLQREDTGQISVDFGVNMARHTSGVAWRVKEYRNGVLFVNTTVRTIADGSFSISRLLAPSSVNHIVATATNPATGETCWIGAYVQ
jgi:hypothetical protein